jgi:parallel beta-helix repeat protein
MKTHKTTRRIGEGKLFAVFFGAALLVTSCKKDECMVPVNATATINPTLKVVDSSAFTRATAAPAYVSSQPIKLNGAHDLGIRGKIINGGTVPAITLSNCYNVHITGNILSNSTSAGIYLYNCYNITIDSNDISNVSTGVSVVNTTKGGILIIWNEFKNMMGPFPRGQFIQFDTVTGPNNLIDNNRCENIFASSYPEDAINLYKSSGTASSPIKVTNNWIRGGGPSASGGGIMLGDNGGSYQLASGNILVDPGQYGMAIAGGDHISMVNNSIYGRSQSFTNIGLYIWGQSGSACTNNTISGNKVSFKNAANTENDAWIGTGESTPSGWSTNKWGANLDASILPSTVVSF